MYGAEVDEYIEGEILMMEEPLMEDRRVIYTVGERVRIDSVRLKTDDDYGIKYWILEVQNYEAPVSQRVYRQVHVVHKGYVDKYRLALAQKAKNAKELVFSTGDKKGSWTPYFSFKNRFAWFKYMYAITVHRSQGSTFKNVFVVNADLDKLRWNHMERNKLKYVAFTRASHRLVIF